MRRRLKLALLFVFTFIVLMAGVKYYNYLYDGMSLASQNRLIQRINPTATLMSKCICDKDHNYIVGEIETTDNKAGFVVFEKKNPIKE